MLTVIRAADCVDMIDCDVVRTVQWLIKSTHRRNAAAVELSLCFLALLEHSAKQMYQRNVVIVKPTVWLQSRLTLCFFFFSQSFLRFFNKGLTKLFIRVSRLRWNWSTKKVKAHKNKKPVQELWYVLVIVDVSLSPYDCDMTTSLSRRRVRTRRGEKTFVDMH